MQSALESLRSEMAEKGKRMEEEIEALRKAGRDRERDLNTLNTVLQCNQDIIGVRTHACSANAWQLKHGPAHALCTRGLCPRAGFTPWFYSDRSAFRPFLQDLRLAVGERERLQREVEKEREVWRQRDRALSAVMQEKEALLQHLREELESCRKDVQVTHTHTRTHTSCKKKFSSCDSPV